jgi:hypothetical protein
MSSVVVVAPLIIAGWPVITAAVTAACASVGFSVATSAAATLPALPTTKVRNKSEIEVEDSEILAESGSVAGELVVERDGVRAVFSRDARGALKLCVEGDHLSKADLKKIGEDLLGRVTQQYVYHRIVTELQNKRMTIVDEHVDADHTVKIRVRNL